jgi:nitroreductase
MDLLEVIQTRRSTRAFKEDKVPTSMLETIVQAGLYAPSGMNKQSWRFTVVENKEIVEELAKLIRIELERDEKYNFYGAPTLILVSNEKENGNGLADCSCALQNIFLMAHDLGIGSCWINQLKSICDVESVRAFLNRLEVPQSHIVWGIAALGYVKEETQEKPRKENTVHWVK